MSALHCKGPAIMLHCADKSFIVLHFAELHCKFLKNLNIFEEHTVGENKIKLFTSIKANGAWIGESEVS